LEVLYYSFSPYYSLINFIKNPSFLKNFRKGEPELDTYKHFDPFKLPTSNENMTLWSYEGQIIMRKELSEDPKLVNDIFFLKKSSLNLIKVRTIMLWLKGKRFFNFKGPIDFLKFSFLKFNCLLYG